MPTMTEPRELLMHELGDLLYAEQLLTKTLPTLADEAEDDDLSAGFASHLRETKGHVANLEQVFQLLGEKPKPEKCPAIEGIKAEHDAFMSNELPSPEIRDLFLTGAGARAEHYEIAAYSGAISLANALGERGAAKLLEQNLAEEKKALAHLERVGGRIAGASAKAMA